MSDSPKQSPLGISVLSALLNNSGLNINGPTSEQTGTSHSPSHYALGAVCNNTCLRLLTYAIRDAYVHKDSRVSLPVYQNLISIGFGKIPALGNSKAISYSWDGYPNWNPYSPYNEITSWGYIRLFALQANNEFNVNSSLPEYKDFLNYFSMVYGHVNYSNSVILTMKNSKEFSPAFSNIDDMICADVTGVNKATVAFGYDLINLGRVLDLSSIDTFGLPSNLLRTLKQVGAINQVTSKHLLQRIPKGEINAILSGDYATPLQEKLIYEAFTLVRDQELIDALVSANCVTAGLTSMADLLSPEKLFPLSKKSLTVPIYNLTPGATTSKIYYPIYDNNGVNPLLESAEIKQQIGSKIVVNISNSEAKINPNYVPQMGFGSYIRGIIPDDIAVAAGAFGVSMTHIKNIKSIPIEKLGQLLTNLETTIGLDLISGVSAPVDRGVVDTALEKIALGSGPYDTYTMSDFLGCMSGLPYPWLSIQSLISAIETPQLYKIYRSLYLACMWEPATAVITCDTRVTESSPGNFDYEYRISGASIKNPGGGYSRGENTPAPAPLITVLDGSLTAVATIGTDDNDILTFGRVKTIVLSGMSGTWINYATISGPIGGPAPTTPEILGLPSIQIECPPDSLLGGSNTPYGTNGWSPGGWPDDPGYSGSDLPGSIWKYINGPYVASNNQRIIADTAEAPFVLSLPSNPQHGWYVIVTDGGNWLTNSLTIDRNGSTIEGRDMNMLVDAMGITLEFVYTLDTWHVTSTFYGRNLPIPGVSGYSGYSGTPGWNGMNDIVQFYINQANDEISVIKTSQPTISTKLNREWHNTGVQLGKEQQAIDVGISIKIPLMPGTSPNNISTFPSQQFSFVDALDQYAADTKPHMAAQTLEAISDLKVIGGQSIVAKMREGRNQMRLMSAGITLDNNIKSSLTDTELKMLMGSTVPSVNQQILPSCKQPNSNISPKPMGGYNPMTNTYQIDGVSVPTGQATTPGSFAGSIYQMSVPPTLDVKYLSGILLPSTYTPSEAIDDVVTCNCNNWG